MSNQSIIEHKANMYYLEFREDYLIICQQCSFKKTPNGTSHCKASDYCKSFILSILEGWTNSKRGKGQDLGVSMSYPQWIESMYGMFGRNVIIDSLDELVGEGLVSRQSHKVFGKDTYLYYLDYKMVNERMKVLEDRDPNATSPLVNPFTSKRVAFTSKRVAFTSKRVDSEDLSSVPFTSKPFLNNTDSNIETTNKLTTPTETTPETNSINSLIVDSQKEMVSHPPQKLQPSEALKIAKEMLASLSEREKAVLATYKQCNPYLNIARSLPQQEHINRFREALEDYATSPLLPTAEEFEQETAWLKTIDRPSKDFKSGFYKSVGVKIWDLSKKRQDYFDHVKAEQAAAQRAANAAPKKKTRQPTYEELRASKEGI